MKTYTITYTSTYGIDEGDRYTDKFKGANFPQAWEDWKKGRVGWANYYIDKVVDEKGTELLLNGKAKKVDDFVKAHPVSPFDSVKDAKVKDSRMWEIHSHKPNEKEEHIGRFSSASGKFIEAWENWKKAERKEWADFYIDKIIAEDSGRVISISGKATKVDALIKQITGLNDSKLKDKYDIKVGAIFKRAKDYYIKVKKANGEKLVLDWIWKDGNQYTTRADNTQWDKKDFIGFLEQNGYKQVNSLYDSKLDSKARDGRPVKVQIDGKIYNGEYVGMSTTQKGYADVYVAELVDFHGDGKKDDLGHQCADGKFYIKVENLKKLNPSLKLDSIGDKKMKDRRITDDEITSNIPNKVGERRYFQLMKPFGEVNAVKVQAEDNVGISGDRIFRNIKSDIYYSIIGYTTSTDRWGSNLSSGWGFLKTDKLGAVKFLKEHQAKVSNWDALTGKWNKNKYDSFTKDELRNLHKLADALTKDSITKADLKKGATFTNEKGAKVVILQEKNTDNEGKEYITYKVGNNSYNHEIDGVINMLNFNHYTKDSKPRDSMKDSKLFRVNGKLVKATDEFQAIRKYRDKRVGDRHVGDPEHTAKYLWTWEEPYHIFDFEGSKKEAKKELDDYYAKLKKVVQQKLEKGYKAHINAINQDQYLTDSMKDEDQEYTIQYNTRDLSKRGLHFVTKKKKIKASSKEEALQKVTNYITQRDPNASDFKVADSIKDAE